MEGEIAVVVVPFLAQGHLNPLLHLSNRLTSYDIHVHFVASTIHNQRTKLRLQGWDPKSLSRIHFRDLDLPHNNSKPWADSPFDSNHPIIIASHHFRQPVCHILHELAPNFRRIVVIHDSLMASAVQDVKSISNAEAYIFRVTSAFTSFFNLWEMLPRKPFELDSGIMALSQLPSLEECFTSKGAEFIKYQYSLSDFQSGILLNTSWFSEGQYLELLQRLSMTYSRKIFAVGPFNPVEIKSGNNVEHIECLDWLDKQEKDSVIFVSFGSSTTMAEEQIAELAEGLERSEQKFIWVVRNADTAAKREVMKPEWLKWYKERVRNKGIMVKEWAPQLEILSHPSTGGFMTHCGWNSCMESISMGVPMATWPLHSEQPRNSILVTEVLRIGVVVRDWANQGELVGSISIQNAVKRLMASEEGVEVRKRAVELGDKVRGSITKVGASNTEIDSFVAHITR